MLTRYGTPRRRHLRTPCLLSTSKSHCRRVVLKFLSLSLSLSLTHSLALRVRGFSLNISFLNLKEQNKICQCVAFLNSWIGFSSIKSRFDKDLRSIYFANVVMSVGNVSGWSHQSRAKRGFGIVQDGKERRLTPQLWLDQSSPKFQRMLRTCAPSMCTKKN